MADVHLTQAEADALLAMAKVREDDRSWKYPEEGGGLSIPLVSKDRREQFFLDVSRGRIDLKREKLQNRARQVAILARLETAGPTHRNPDDSEIPCPHIHLYREGYADKWAFPIPADRFTHLEDAWQTLQEFIAFCNVTEPPTITGGLFV